METWVDGAVIAVQGEEFTALVLVTQAEDESKKNDFTLKAEIQEWLTEKGDEMTAEDAEKRGFTKLSTEITSAALEEAQNVIDWPEFE